MIIEDLPGGGLSVVRGALAFVFYRNRSAIARRDVSDTGKVGTYQRPMTGLLSLLIKSPSLAPYAFGVICFSGWKVCRPRHVHCDYRCCRP